MENMADKITEFLEDDKSVDMLKNLSAMLGVKNTGENKENKSPFNNIDLKKIIELSSGFKNDERLDLMRALRPFVSEHKRESLDSISNILRLIKLLSLVGGEFKLF